MSHTQTDGTPRESFETRFARFFARKHEPSAFIQLEFLRNCRFHDELVRSLRVSGWEGALTLSCDTDVEDVCEFLASYQLLRPHRSFVLQYQHRGVQYRASLADIREVFGWPAPTIEEEYPTTAEHGILDAYGDLSAGYRRQLGGRTSAGNMAARYLREPMHYYLQKVVSHSLFARAEGRDKVTLADMRVIAAVDRGTIPDYAQLIVRHWDQRESRGAVMCGGPITYFLRVRHGEPIELEGHTILPARELDQKAFGSMKAIQSRRGRVGQFAFTYHPDVQYHEQMPEDPLPRGRAARASRREQTEIEGGESSAAGAARRAQTGRSQFQQAPPAFTQEQLDYMYHMQRVMHFMVPAHIQPVPAPPGWLPGQPIRPEDEIPRDPSA